MIGAFDSPIINKSNLISKESLLIFLFLFATIIASFSSIRAMKVHPMPKKRNNVTISFEMSSRNPSFSPERVRGKKLRRLPHVFSRVLELPFRSDADVAVEESAESFRFVAGAEIGSDFRAHTVEIHPGVTKIVVREGDAAAELTLDELELDMWRFRLPETTRPELASAVFVDGELIVTVPKGEVGDDGDDGEVWGDENGGNGGFGGGMGGRLVLVQ